MLVKMPVKGKPEIQFWIHAFHLEKDIETVVNFLNNDVRRKTAFCPIITTYEAGEMHFHILLGASVDAVGLVNGFGRIWLSTNKEHRADAEKEWRTMSDETLDTAQKSGKWEETIEIEEGREV